MSYTDKVALVTGASRGIGQAIAYELGKAGCVVVGTATTEKGADKISSYLEENHIKGRGLCLNVTDKENLTNTVETIQKECGPIEILVNNAAITQDNLMMRMTDDQWQSVIDTNLNAVFNLSKLVLKPMMKGRFGRIINLTSVVGFIGNAGQTNYAAAKAGVVGFSKSLAQEVASRGITVNNVAPGFIDTDMTKALPEAQREQLLNRIPAKALGDVKDVANCVLFLASSASGYITGETIHVNGGMYMA